MSYRSLEWIFTLRLPECRGTPCSKQARYLKITSFAKWLSVCLRTKRLWVWVFWNYYSHGLLWYFSNIENLIHLTRFTLYVMRGAIWHHLYNLKNVKNTHGWVFTVTVLWCFILKTKIYFIDPHHFSALIKLFHDGGRYHLQAVALQISGLVSIW